MKEGREKREIGNGRGKIEKEKRIKRHTWKEEGWRSGKNWKRKKGLNDILEKEKEEGVGKIEQGKKHKMNNREA
jgi:hypothetical protein